MIPPGGVQQPFFKFIAGMQVAGDRSQTGSGIPLKTGEVVSLQVLLSGMLVSLAEDRQLLP